MTISQGTTYKSFAEGASAGLLVIFVMPAPARVIANLVALNQRGHEKFWYRKSIIARSRFTQTWTGP